MTTDTTPNPFRTLYADHHDTGAWFVYAEDPENDMGGFTYARGLTEKQAKFIVRACNEYNDLKAQNAALLKAAEQCVQGKYILQWVKDNHPNHQFPAMEYGIKLAEEALAAAKVQS